MKMQLLKIVSLFLLAASLVIGGCAAQEQQTRRYLWPRPPDQPRIEWVKSYYSQHSFPKSGFETFVENLFGQSAPIAFEKPIDIKSNGEGLVYIADIAIPGIVVYDLNNSKVELWAKGSDPENSLYIVPYYIALDRDNNIYAVGSGAKKIYVLNKKGTVVNRIDFGDHVKAPAGIYVDSADGRIYLADIGDSKVAVFDLAGKHLFDIGKGGSEDGELNRPLPVTMNHKGELIVGDTMNCRVQIFSKDGKFLRKFGQRGDTAADFQVIKGISVDSDDNVYVTDGKSNQMKIFSTNGDYLLTIGTAYSVTKTMKEAPGGFLLPQGIHIDRNNNIFIADQANVRFQIFKYLSDAEGKGQSKAGDGAK
jgi:DNA-binding beta-propeller fold protein YncE